VEQWAELRRERSVAGRLSNELAPWEGAVAQTRLGGRSEATGRRAISAARIVVCWHTHNMSCCATDCGVMLEPTSGPAVIGRCNLAVLAASVEHYIARHTIICTLASEAAAVVV
jgi:hypothetical protein